MTRPVKVAAKRLRSVRRGPCLWCGECWEVGLSPWTAHTGRDPTYCARCADLRKHLGQIERLVTQSWVAAPHPELFHRVFDIFNRIGSLATITFASEAEALECRRRLFAVVNRIPAKPSWKFQKRDKEGKWRRK